MDIHLERLLRQHGQTTPQSKRILEVNPRHPLIHRLADKVKGDGNQPDAKEAAYLLLDQARIMEGDNPEDPSAFAKRLSDLVAKGLAA
jgi:molecular chaperone HtpG